MLLSEPRPGRWELHGRMLGADIRIRPLFWASCALLGVIFYQYPEILDEIGGAGAFALWMGVVLFSILAHEMGHILAARAFGAPVRIVLSGLGGQLFGLEALSRWRKVLICLAGPLANLLLIGVWLAITAFPLPVERIRPDLLAYLVHGVWLLGMVNAFWGLLNLLPLWPLNGGRMAVEIGEGCLGRRGQTVALLFSLTVCLALTLTVLRWMGRTLINRFDPHYRVYFAYFCILSIYCYALWLSSFRALWGEPRPSEPRP